MDRVILHSDLNGFYASVECVENPALRDKPVVVCGDGIRHGIVLAKNEIAKRYKIKTGDVIWEAKQKCPDLVTVSADFNKYLRYSALVKKLYNEYTNQVESFGIDEAWLDVTGQNGEQTAEAIRKRVREETGLTVSVGVSYNKIFAKLGSDMKKPDAVTVISRGNYREKIFPLPAGALLYVGRKTREKLAKYNINTIGEIAAATEGFLRQKLGKWGEHIWRYANGFDTSPVMCVGEESMVKSVGNSTTTVRDLESVQDVLTVVTVLGESVAARLYESGLKGQVVSLYIKDKDFADWGKQARISHPTYLAKEIIEKAMMLFQQYDFSQPIRSVGVRMSDLTSAKIPVQMDLFEETARLKEESLERAIMQIRNRYGHFALCRGIEYFDKTLSGFSPKNLIFPLSKSPNLT